MSSDNCTNQWAGLLYNSIYFILQYQVTDQTLKILAIENISRPAVDCCDRWKGKIINRKKEIMTTANGSRITTYAVF